MNIEESIKNRIEQDKKWEKKKNQISRKNADLIEKWRKEKRPWWKFWDRGLSFEEQRSIIMSNWKELDNY